MPKLHAKTLRLGRYSLNRKFYLATAVILHRRPVFAEFAAAQVLIAALQTIQKSERARTLAFVAMPDHVQWLMVLGDGAELTSVAQAVKSVTAHRLGGRVWQRGFHDRLVRHEEDV